MGWTMVNVFLLGLPWLACKMFDIETPTERELAREDLVFPYRIVLNLRPLTATKKGLERLLERLHPDHPDEVEKAFGLLMDGKEYRFLASNRQLQIVIPEQGEHGMFSKVNWTPDYSKGCVYLNGDLYRLSDTGWCNQCLHITSQGRSYTGASVCYDCSGEDTIPFGEDLTNADVRTVEKLMNSPKAAEARERREKEVEERRAMLHEQINSRSSYH